MKLFDFRKAMTLTVYAVAVSVISLMVGCGGGGSYDAPESSSSVNPNAWWEGYDVAEDTLLSADTVVEWLQGRAAPADFVILDVQTDFSAAVDRIIGSTAKADIEAFTTTEGRAEGPVDTVAIGDTSASMVPTGATMDAIIQDLGITKDTVIVLTGSNGGYAQWDLTRGWWMFYYWGFAETKVKILDGGVAAVKAIAPELVNTTAESVDPSDSVFSVKDLPALRASARVSTKEVIDAVKGGKVQIVDVRGGIGTTGIGFAGRIKGATVVPFGVVHVDEDADTVADRFATKAEFETYLTDNGITLDGSKKIIVHCYSGKSATPMYYFLKEVMGYDNIALYDGSWSAWSAHLGYTLADAAATPEYTTAKDVNGAFTGTPVSFVLDRFKVVATDADVEADAANPAVIVPGGALQIDSNANLLPYETVRFSEGVLFNNPTSWAFDIYTVKYDVDADYAGNGKEIAAEDAAYIASDDNEGSEDEEDADNGGGTVTPDGGGC